MTLYTTTWPHKEPALPHSGEQQVIGGVATHFYATKASPWGSRLPHSPALLDAVAEHASEFDIVVTHSLWNPVATFAGRILRKSNKKYCVMPHGMLDQIVLKRGNWKKSAWALLWERRNVEQSALIIFNTQTEKEKAHSCGWNLPQSMVMPHVIDLSAWKNLPPRREFDAMFPQVCGREVILFVGRINWVKNIGKLIESLAIVRHIRPAAALVCVGPSDNGHRAELERKVQELKLGDSVMFTGMLTGEQLKAAYARGAMLALVSQKENFGLVVAEALASGLPVVVSTGVDLSSEWPSTGPVRRVTPTTENIAAAILDLLEKTDGQKARDDEARKLAEKEWGSSRVEKLLSAYSTILSEEYQ